MRLNTEVNLQTQAYLCNDGVISIAAKMPKEQIQIEAEIKTQIAKKKT